MTIDRSNVESVAKLLDARIPDENRRTTFLRDFLRLIHVAHSVNPNSWSITLQSRRLTLNIAQIRLFGLLKNGIRISFKDADLDDATRQFLTEHLQAHRGRSSFKSIPGSTVGVLPQDRYFEIREKLAAPLEALGREAARYDARNLRSHSPNVIDYIEQVLEESVPRPPASGTASPQHADLEELFDEFIEDYFETPKGQEHIEGYPKARATAQSNYARITELKSEGKDATDAILEGLLPHQNTPFNRERGTWTHVAPAITRDVKQWFEGAKWVKPEDWPKVADAIWNFVSRCVEEPDDLEAHCRWYGALPESKGFQSGILTPVLNALRPERFAIFNGKSRPLLNHLLNLKLSAAIEQYPEANGTIFRVVEETAPIQEAADQSQASPLDLFDCFAHWAIGIRKIHDDSAPSIEYWKISPGVDAELWDEWVREGYASIGWNEFGDVSAMSKNEFTEKMSALDQEHDNYQTGGMSQVWSFSRIPPGSYIVANQGTTEVLGVGRVIGDYAFDPDAGRVHHHVLPVEWIDLQRREISQGGWRRTMVKLNRNRTEEILGISLEELGDEPAQLPAASPEPAPKSEVRDSTTRERAPSYTIDDLQRETNLPRQKLRSWVNALERKKQAILYGPPGTGKTYVAERLARLTISGSNGFTELVQFHPSYSYEEFIEGIRPQSREDGTLIYPTVPGRFIDFCEKATTCDGPAVFIIDEINRANLSRVFGELMYLLEYRDKAIVLASGRRFSIPGNVRVIGTMNTADRSIALVDHALRRRFAFLELEPVYETLQKFHAAGDFPVGDLITLLRKLNDEIEVSYRVGITYFLDRNLERNLEAIWSFEILPYLEEYFFSDPKRATQYSWESVRKQIFRDEAEQ